MTLTRRGQAVAYPPPGRTAAESQPGTLPKPGREKILKKITINLDLHIDNYGKKSYNVIVIEKGIPDSRPKHTGNTHTTKPTPGGCSSIIAHTRHNYKEDCTK